MKRKLSAHAQVLKSVRRRHQNGEYGCVSTAEIYLRQLAACAGDAQCSQILSEGVKLVGQQFTKYRKDAKHRLVYANDEMRVEEHESNAGRFSDFLKASKLDGLELPKHTLLVFKNVITSPKTDRDGDVLYTDGAIVDERMPLLWQHMWMAPIGRMLSVLDHTAKVLRVASVIVDNNELSHDAAVLVEAGCLRISHGFRPLEIEARKDKNGNIVGFDIKSFEIMEESVVSIPSNTDAVIEEVSREKLTSPLMKQWAKQLKELKPTTVAVGANLSGASGENSQAPLVAAGGAQTDQVPPKESRSSTDAVPKDGTCACGGKHGGKEAASGQAGASNVSPDPKASDVPTSEKGRTPMKHKGLIAHAEEMKADKNRPWDPSQARSNMLSWAKGEDASLDLKESEGHRGRFSRGFAWVVNDGTKASDYKFAHHDVVGGEPQVVFRGVQSAMRHLNGRARDYMTGAERKEVYSHLAKHYEEFGEQAPKLKGIDSEGTKDAELPVVRKNADLIDDCVDLVQKIMDHEDCTDPIDKLANKCMSNLKSLMDDLYPEDEGDGEDDGEEEGDEAGKQPVPALQSKEPTLEEAVAFMLGAMTEKRLPYFERLAKTIQTQVGIIKNQKRSRQEAEHERLLTGAR